MHLLLNDQRREIPPGCLSVEALIGYFFPDFSGVVEYNGRVLARDEWVHTSLSDGDRLEVVQIVGGG